MCVEDDPILAAGIAVHTQETMCQHPGWGRLGQSAITRTTPCPAGVSPISTSSSRTRKNSRGAAIATHATTSS